MAPAPPRRWPTALLLAWLPLVKWGLPAGPLRAVLFFGGGSALAAFAVRREGDGPRVRPVFAAPGQGVWDALWLYAGLTVTSLLVLYAPLLGPLLPYAAYDLAALFDPLPVYVALKRGDALPSASVLTLTLLGSAAEEWIFHVALFWRWLPAPLVEAAPLRRLLAPAAWWRLAALSAFFAALHWPQPLGAMAVALLGSVALGLVLLWRPSYALVATLHVLFNLARLGAG
jgi:hypothetical protein